MGEQYIYYRCASWLRGEPCEASRQQIREQVLEPQLDQYMRMLELPPDWRKQVEKAILTDTGKEDLEKRKNDLRGQLRRLNYQFEHGLIDDADLPAYEKRAQKLIREINSIVIPTAVHHIEQGEQLISFASSWGKADKSQRHGILREIFEAVYVDTDTKLVVGVRPYAEFVPMFRQTKLVERDGQFVLKNDDAAQGSDSTERHYVQYGRDGIRTRGLCLDRAAC